MTKKERIIFLSLDALGTSDFEYLLNKPELRNIFRNASFVRNVSSVFVTNTYTVHTSIVSGSLPYRHGIIDNTVFAPGNRTPNWRWYEKDIRTNTLLKEAVKRKIKTAAILWPVTAKSKVQYNIPEIFPTSTKENQIMTSLRSGSKLFQLQSFLKYKNLLDGLNQPNLDNFSFSALKDVITKKNPQLIFAHFTDVDSMKHMYGINSKEVEEGINRHATRLKELFDLLKSLNKLENTTVFIFGDHSALNVHTGININKVLEDLGLYSIDKEGFLYDCKAWFKSCGGTAFLRLRKKRDKELVNLTINKIREEIKNGNSGIRRLLTKDEMRTSGFASMYEFGIEAKEGFYFTELDSQLEDEKYKGVHGYSLNNENYTTSIIALGHKIKNNVFVKKASILDICPTALEILKIEPWEMDGKSIKDILL